MSDLDRIFADIAVLEAVLNVAKAAGDEESAQKGTATAERAVAADVETPQPRREVSSSLSIEEWLRGYRPREGAEGAAVAMDWEAPEHKHGHG